MERVHAVARLLPEGVCALASKERLAAKVPGCVALVPTVNYLDDPPSPNSLYRDFICGEKCSHRQALPAGNTPTPFDACFRTERVCVLLMKKNKERTPTETLC